MVQMEGRAKVCYLLFAGLVCGHVTLQLCAAAEGLTAERAAEALLVLLMSILDVFLQRRQAFVAAVAIRTGEQLGEVVRCVTPQLCTQSKTDAILSSSLAEETRRTSGAPDRKQVSALYRARSPPGPAAQVCPGASALLVLLGK